MEIREWRDGSREFVAGGAQRGAAPHSPSACLPQRGRRRHGGEIATHGRSGGCVAPSDV